MIALRLLRSFGIWNAGEVAGFHAERAAELIANGWAERDKAIAEAPAEAPAEAVPMPVSLERATRRRS